MRRHLTLLPLAAWLVAATPLPPQPAGVPWPTARWADGPLPGGVDRAALETATAALFEPIGRGGIPDTRALLVVQGGRVVWERNASGFGADSRFRSWSMAKSVTNALIGVLVRDGRLALDAPAPVPRWQRDGDPRRALTLRQLLNMTSGLDNADGGDDADSYVARIFFGDLSADSAAGSEQVELAYEPGTHWAYSTATSQILSGIVARTVGGGREGVRAFLERELIAPLGASSLVVEFDPAGTPLGGGYVWASARDWARLGLLYLRDGVWAGRRILPEGWVEFTRTVAPADEQRHLRRPLLGERRAGRGPVPDPPARHRGVRDERQRGPVRGDRPRSRPGGGAPRRDAQRHVATAERRTRRADRGLPAARGSPAMMRWVLIAVFWVLLVGGALVYEWGRDQAAVGAGYVAKELCSCVFVGERSLASCRPDIPLSMDRVEAELGADRVRAFVPYFAERIARFEPPFGCVLY